MSAFSRVDEGGVGSDVLLVRSLLLHRRTWRAVISVVDYDLSWPTRFAALRDTYARAFDAACVPFVAIEHVGSTAVAGLPAKPVIDIDVVVAGTMVAAGGEVLSSLGFTALGELGIPRRWAFKQLPDLDATNTYIIVAKSLSLRNHLALRDTLRADLVLRDKYADLKRAVAAVAEDIDAYGRGKNKMIQEILTAAGLRPDELDSTNDNQVPSHTEVPR